MLHDIDDVNDVTKANKWNGKRWLTALMSIFHGDVRTSIDESSVVLFKSVWPGKIWIFFLLGITVLSNMFHLITQCTVCIPTNKQPPTHHTHRPHSHRNTRTHFFFLVSFPCVPIPIPKRLTHHLLSSILFLILPISVVAIVRGMRVITSVCFTSVSPSRSLKSHQLPFANEITASSFAVSSTKSFQTFYSQFVRRTQKQVCHHQRRCRRRHRH